MKPEKKGQQVKTFKAYVPQSDLTNQEAVIKVYFQAADGQFRIYPPQHIVDVVSRVFHEEVNKNMDNRYCMFVGGALSAPTMQAVIDGFSSACDRYSRILTDEQRIKVILFKIAANHPRGASFPSISFTSSPALSFTYEVLWSAGSKLYRQDAADDPLEYVGAAQASPRSGNFVVDWTPEREAFFAALHAGLVGLIDRLRDFTGDIEGNIQAAIEGRAPAFLLPPPSADRAAE